MQVDSLTELSGKPSHVGYSCIFIWMVTFKIKITVEIKWKSGLRIGSVPELCMCQVVPWRVAARWSWLGHWRRTKVKIQDPFNRSRAAEGLTRQTPGWSRWKEDVMEGQQGRLSGLYRDAHLINRKLLWTLDQPRLPPYLTATKSIVTISSMPHCLLNCSFWFPWTPPFHLSICCTEGSEKDNSQLGWDSGTLTWQERYLLHGQFHDLLDNLRVVRP